VQRVPSGLQDDRARLDEMAGLRGDLAASIEALEAEVGRLRDVVATASAPVVVEPPAPLELDWDLPPLDPAWLEELDALVGAPTAPEPVVAPAAPEPAVVEPQPQPVRLPRVRRPTLPALLATVGALAIADCVITLAWEEPVTSLYGAWQQDRLEDRLAALEADAADVAAPDPAEGAGRSVRELEAARMAAAATRLQRSADAGAPIGRLRAPKLGKGSLVMVEGTGGAELRSGPGRYEHTGLPGQPGATFGVAGHRTSWSAPFRHIDRLDRGDRLTVTMPYGRFTYAVRAKRIVRPEDVWVLQDRTRSRLVLTACHPLFSAAKRIVVTAELVRATPRGAARVAS
jgi:sortase A